MWLAERVEKSSALGPAFIDFGSKRKRTLKRFLSALPLADQDQVYAEIVVPVAALVLWSVRS